MNDMFSLHGMWDVEIYQPDGVTLVNKFSFKNANPLAALNDLLSVYLAGGSQSATWYLALINNTPSPSLSTNDTSSSHGGWSEFTNYTESVRQTWTPGSVTGQSVTNPTSASFTMDTGGGAVYGAFLISVSTKGGTTGTLYGGAAFSGDRAVINGDTLNVTVTLTAAAA